MSAAPAPTPADQAARTLAHAQETLDTIERYIVSRYRAHTRTSQATHEARNALRSLKMAADNLDQALDRAEAAQSAEENVSGLEHAHILELRQQLTDAQAAQQTASASLEQAVADMQAASERVDALTQRMDQLTTSEQADTTA